MWANKAEPHNPRVLGIHILYFPFCIHSSRYNMILHYKKIPTCTPPFEVTGLSLNLDSTVSRNHHGSMLCLRSKISGKSWLLRFVRIKLSPNETNHTDMLNGLSRPKPMNSVSISNYTCYHSKTSSTSRFKFSTPKSAFRDTCRHVGLVIRRSTKPKNLALIQANTHSHMPLVCQLSPLRAVTITHHPRAKKLCRPSSNVIHDVNKSHKSPSHVSI